MIFIIAAIILSADQLTKYLAVKNLFPQQSLPVIKDVFHFTLIYNRGAAFGLLKGQVYLFIFAAAAAVILIGSDLTKQKKISLYSLSWALILAGAAGNLIDRVSHGYVIDFLDFRIWPVFNIADSAITIGAVLLGRRIINKSKA